MAKAKQQAAAPAADAQPATEPAAKLPSRSIVPVDYRKRCVRDKAHRTPGGNPTVSCGDALARFLAGKTVEQVAEIAQTASGGALQASALLSAYAHLNLGQRRMNIGNRIRALVKEGSWTVPTEAAKQ